MGQEVTPTYTRGDLERLTGLPEAELERLAGLGLLPPAGAADAPAYTLADVHRVLDVKRYLAEGWSLGRVRAMLLGRGEEASEPKAFASRGPLDRLAGARLSSIYPVRNRAELMRRVEPHRGEGRGDREGGTGRGGGGAAAGGSQEVAARESASHETAP